MTKVIQKKKRRLKKTVRKTLGTLFLISSLIVAAIPVENLQAADIVPRIEAGVDGSSIPKVNDNETIYTTGDGKFQFAYVNTPNDIANKVAVILGYAKGGELEGGRLVIPDSVDAYLNYSSNQGTGNGYAAVGRSGNFLFYSAREQVKDADGNPMFEEKPVLDGEGKPVVDEGGKPLTEQVPVMETVYYPCYWADRAKWEKLSLEQFYYNAADEHNTNTDPNAKPDYRPTTTSEKQRITGAQVRYIGNQYLEKGDKDGSWKIAGTITAPENGIFANVGNLRELAVGQNLSGIGVYAFYGCSSMKSITLGNGLDTISNDAFANCINMENVNLNISSNVQVIGARAFYNCQALKSFQVPISVTQIGDSAFEGCWAIEHIELCGNGQNVSLMEIGNNVFKSCTQLKSLTFPKNFTNEGTAIDITNFQGCTSLQYISVGNDGTSFDAGIDFDFAAFKAQLPAEFYFEGFKDSDLHKLASNNQFAFSFLNPDLTKQNLYEITVKENGGTAIYRVNSSNELVYCEFTKGMDTVTLPTTIGPYKITAIDSGTFQNNCWLKKITMPPSIATIADSAFMGCHNLENVIFTDPANMTSIGANAFKTQQVAFHKDDCTTTSLPNPPDTLLKFTGPVSYSTVPFTYAMDPNNYFTNGSQNRTYITYYSGWPSNLEVRYNEETDKNELTDYPTFAELKSGNKYTAANYEYITPEYEQAAQLAVAKYEGTNQEPMTDYERQIIDSALNIVLPEGIESIKEKLFIENEQKETTDVEKTITAYSLNEIAGAEFDEEGNRVPDSVGAFAGFKNLTKISLLGGTASVGNYAFEDCEKLTTVLLPPSLTEMGLRPFKGCEKLGNVDFQGSSNFTCVDSIIYTLSGGNKTKLVEVLEGRSYGVIEADELAGVTELAPEAFADTNVSSVDLKGTTIKDVPERAFANTEKLFGVYLPESCFSISKNAFENSAVSYMEVPKGVGMIDANAFNGVNLNGLQFYCEDDSYAYNYAKQAGIKTTSKPPAPVYYTVKFWSYDNTLLDTQTVEEGKDAVPPEAPEREGYIFDKWFPGYTGITKDTDAVATYIAEDPDAHKFTVKFLDWDDTELKTMLVAPGADAEPPFDPKREGYTFTGWRPAITNIQQDTTIYAQYEKNDSEESKFTVRFIDYNDNVLYVQRVKAGESAIMPQAPTREGYTFTGWRPAITNITKDLDTYAQYAPKGSVDDPDNDNNGGNNNGGNNNGGNNGGDNNGNNNGGNNGGDNNGNNNGGNNGNNNQTTTKMYTLTVRNGSGSGSYVAGSQPIVIANDPAEGQEFSNWSIEPTDVAIASKAVTATVITMPEKNVTVTANYKAKGTTTTGSGNSAGSGSNNNSGGSSGTVNRPNNTGSGSTSKGGTTVVIDKNGLSNTGVVSATVKGSSDNFTIKVTESSAAAEAAVKALMTEYGDLTNIKYFPMDISLYDSTGTKKITDTSGLSVTITLPLPDSLITYAGNNKVAGIVDERLDKLSPKFTTISGVSCITFTAEHFSPYVLYVDTGMLSEGTVADNTPKTGDGIHPKWFLSIGLACLAFVLFMQKDRRTLKKVRVRA